MVTQNRAQLQAIILRLEAELASARADVATLMTQLEIDAGTGVSNRHGLHRAFQQMVARCSRGQSPCVLVIIDIDEFKQINDTLGHAIGDRALSDFAAFLTSHVRVNDCVARIGGDEFAILFDGMDLASASRKMTALRLIERGSDLVPGFSFSFGICNITADAAFDAIFNDADSAMYADKIARRRPTTL